MQINCITNFEFSTDDVVLYVSMDMNFDSADPSGSLSNDVTIVDAETDAVVVSEVYIAEPSVSSSSSGPLPEVWEFEGPAQYLSCS